MIGFRYARRNRTDRVGDKDAFEGTERKNNGEESGMKSHFR